MPAVKSIQLPVDVVVALFEFAGRGRLDREEWRFLEHWERTVQQGIAQASQPKPEADATIPPAFDPNTEEAERKRQRRRDRRKAEAAAKAIKEAMLESIGGDPSPTTDAEPPDADAGGEPPAA